jgi:hypothetical protein
VSEACSEAAIAQRSPAGDLPAGIQEHVRFGATGAVIDAALTVEDWSALVGYLARLDNGVPWWIGDVLVFGEHVYGSKYAAAAEATGLTLKTLKNYAWVARSVPAENRDPALPWSIHREVARLDAVEQRAWLSDAKDHAWTTDDLKRELTAALHRQRERPSFEAISSDEQGQLDRVRVTCPNCEHAFAVAL